MYTWIDGGQVSVPTTQTSHTVTGLRPNGQYYLYVVAIDRFGRKAYSNQLTVVTLPDGVAPSTPTNLRVTGVTASKISLAWNASTDNAGIAEYLLSINPWKGRAIFTGPTSVDIIGLPPETTFSIAVRARDFGWNYSPFSAAVTATTLASADTTPPTMPTNLRVGNLDGCGEVRATWAQSTDDQDPQAAIRYEFTINGQPDPFRRRDRPRPPYHVRHRRRGQHVRRPRDRQRRQRVSVLAAVHAGRPPLHLTM